METLLNPKLLDFRCNNQAKTKRKILKELLKNSSPTPVLVLNLEKHGPTLQLRKKMVFPKNASTFLQSSQL